MPQSPAKVYARRVEECRRLAEVAARHRANGHPERAEVFDELLVEAKSRLDATPKPEFVTVGDHTPEPRVEHVPQFAQFRS